jgi:PAS domain S-box-containing protein
MSNGPGPDRVGGGLGPAEQALRSALPYLGDLFSASPTFLHLLRYDGVTFRGVWVGGSVTRLFGYTPEEACRPGWWIENVHPDDRAAAVADQAALFRDGHLVHEYRFRRQDGTYRWVRDELRLLGHGEGRPPCEAVGAWVDITDRKQVEEALRERERRYALATAAGRVGVWDYDVIQGRFHPDPFLMEFWDARRLGGRADDPWAWLELIHPDDRGAMLTAYRDCLEGRAADLQCDYRILAPGGECRWGQTRGSAVRGPDGRALRLVGTTLDITERKRTEGELRRSGARYRALVRASSEAVWVVGPGDVGSDEGLAWWCATTGQTPEEVRDRGWLAAVHPDDRERARSEWLAAQAGGGPYDVEYRVRSRDGGYRHVAVRGVLTGSSACPEWIGTFTDVTDRRRAEGEVRAASQRLQALSRRLLEVQEQERRHLARELHDEIGQFLTGLKLQLEAAGLAAPAGVAAQLADARTLLRDLTERVRELSLRLRPTMLDDFGLLPALRWLFGRYTAQTGVRVRLTQHGADRRFPPEVETAAYRIVQEALTNVVRHSGVAEADVSLECAGAWLTVTVADRGAGFDPAAAATRPTGGLSGMRERAELLGGDLVIETAAGTGTRVTARLPGCDQEEGAGGGAVGAVGG